MYFPLGALQEAPFCKIRVFIAEIMYFKLGALNEAPF
jgi:hypothetical protein